MTIPTPGQALWNQRHCLSGMRERLRTLVDAVARPTDFAPFQWAQVLALTLEYQPDVVIELGRGMGNSTSCFLEAAARLRGIKKCKVLSLCLSDFWSRETEDRLRKVCSPEWFAPGDIREGNILEYDFGPVLQGAEKCLVLWDAHGFEVAECVLGNLLPRLADRSHIVLMHDMTDLRYATIPSDYGRFPMWKGENGTTSVFWLGHISSSVSQAISIVDFSTRNQLPLHSADESLHAAIGGDPARMQEMGDLLGEFFSLSAHWFWFSLNEAPRPLTFPSFVAPRKLPFHDGCAAPATLGPGGVASRRGRKFSLRRLFSRS